MIVSDTNLLVHYLLNGAEHESVAQIRALDPEWIAPGLWKSEFRSVLSLYLRKQILSFEDIQKAMVSAEQMMMGRSFDSNSLHVLSLVNQSSCSAYDCEFVALAEELEIKLVTFDKKILSAFPEVAVTPENFSGLSAPL